MRNRTLKALSLVLSYPGADLQQAMPDIAAVLGADPRISVETRAALAALTGDLAQGDLYDLQERYVMLFDRSRSLSLNLFEHVHGESRDRGGAMVSLIETYRAGGFEPVTTELPDHLPVLLEFLSTRPFAEAQEILADAAHILDALNARLRRRESGYAGAGRGRGAGRDAGAARRRPHRSGRTRQGLGGNRGHLRPRSECGLPAGPRHAGPDGQTRHAAQERMTCSKASTSTSSSSGSCPMSR
jgi:nitrate reductase molybdenum cofactor assembly chaperone